MFFKFDKNDILRNRIKTYPYTICEMADGEAIYQRRKNVSYDNSISIFGENILEIYPYVYKNSELLSFKSVTEGDINSIYKYGDIITGSYPLTASITQEYLTPFGDSIKFNSLRNKIDYNKIISSDFNSEILETKDIGVINIPKIFYGTSLKKGSIKLTARKNDNIVSIAEDLYNDGLLRETSGSHEGESVGLILYNDGILLMTGSWCLGTGVTTQWRSFGDIDSLEIASTIEFKGVNYTNTLTCFAHAKKGELNSSNNPTFTEEYQTFATSSAKYLENVETKVQNVVTSSYSDLTSSFKRQTFISKVLVYDEDKKLLGIASLATPIKKLEKDEFTFKLNLDL